jgi:hypothetical protein
VALTLEAHTDETLDLEALLSHLRDHADARDEASVIEAAPKLRALANHRTFLAEELSRRLLGWRTQERARVEYISETFTLGYAGSLCVRANVWTPAPPNATEQGRGRITLYGLPHDHNFSFLTCGYVGPGYETVIYEVDPQSVRGVVGEETPLTFLERTTLPAGKVMFYRACRDVHEQGFPTAFSVSLNVTLVPPAVVDRDQYYFDTEAQRIVGFSGPIQAGRMMLCRLAAELGDAGTASALEELAARHASPRVRAEAYTSLATLTARTSASPAAALDVWRRALADAHPQVTALARTRLDEQGESKPRQP